MVFEVDQSSDHGGSSGYGSAGGSTSGNSMGGRGVVGGRGRRVERGRGLGARGRSSVAGGMGAMEVLQRCHRRGTGKGGTMQ